MSFEFVINLFDSDKAPVWLITVELYKLTLICVIYGMCIPILPFF